MNETNRLGGWACVLGLMMGCADDRSAPPATIDRTPPSRNLDASTVQPSLDADLYTPEPRDAAQLGSACAPLPVCTESKQSLLYNVCITGAASTALSTPACLVDPNGVLYLAPLGAGQRVVNDGWTESTSGTLGAADLERCESARTALLADASTLPACAGGTP